MLHSKHDKWTMAIIAIIKDAALKVDNGNYSHYQRCCTLNVTIAHSDYALSALYETSRVYRHLFI